MNLAMTHLRIRAGKHLALSAILLLFGCSQNEHPELRQVKGTILYNGEPVEDAVVAFYNDNSLRLASGRTDADGEFYLTSFNNNDGALPGEHTVVVSKTESSAAEEAPKLSMDEAAKVRPRKFSFTRRLLPAKYASVDTSPLKVTVNVDQSNDVTLELTDD